MNSRWAEQMREHALSASTSNDTLQTKGTLSDTRSGKEAKATQPQGAANPHATPTTAQPTWCSLPLRGSCRHTYIHHSSQRVSEKAHDGEPSRKPRLEDAAQINREATHSYARPQVPEDALMSDMPPSWVTRIQSVSRKGFARISIQVDQGPAIPKRRKWIWERSNPTEPG